MNFGLAMSFVFEHEGGYVNDPRDAGGETKFGISKRAYPYLDIKNLTKAQAQDIYMRDYWLTAGCDKLPDGIDMAVFDTAVNSGVSRAKYFLKESTTVRDYLEKRRAFLIGLHNPRFEKGWLNRVNDLAKFIDIHKQ